MLNSALLKSVIAAGLILFVSAPDACGQVPFTPTGHLSHFGPYDTGKTNNDLMPKVATNGTNTWVSAWVDDNLRGNIEFVHSVDGGVTWIEQSFLDPQDVEQLPGETALVNTSVEWLDIVYAGDNTWVVAWSLTDRDGWDETRNYAATSTDNGQTWTDGIRLDAAGSDFALGLNLASDGAGNVIALWEIDASPSTSPLVVARSTDFGQTWSAPTPVSAVLGEAASDQAILKYVGSDTWTIVFSREDAADVRTIFTATSTDDGVTWTLNAPVVAETSKHELHYNLHGFSGIVAVPYYSNIDFSTFNPELGTGDLYVAVSSDGGVTFDVPTLVQEDVRYWGYNSPVVNIAASSSGSWAITTGLADESGNIAAWRTDNPQGTWEPVVLHNRGETVNSGNPILAGGASDQFISIFPFIDTSLSIEHWDSDIMNVRSTDGGKTWSVPSYVNPDAGADFVNVRESEPEIVAANGIVMAKWIAKAHGHFDSVVFARSEDGGLTWSNTQVLFTDYMSASSLHYIGADQWMLNIPGNAPIKSTDNGLTWTTPVWEAEAYRQMASDGNGTVIRWSSYSKLYTVSNDYGATWQTISRLLNAPNHVVWAGGSNWVHYSLQYNMFFTSSDNGVSSTYHGAPGFSSIGIEHVLADGAGNLAAFGVLQNPPSEPNRTATIAVTTSSDYGVTWSNPIEVHTEQRNIDPGYDAATLAVHLTPVSLGGGNWQLYMYFKYNAQDAGATTFFQDEHLYRMKSSNGGQTWTAPISFEPAAPVDTAEWTGENLIIAWTDTEIAPPLTPTDSDVLYKVISNPVTAAADWQLFE